MKTKSSRRTFLKNSAIAGATYLVGPPAFRGSLRGSVIVIGAGAFGGWSALDLLQTGRKVTLLDAWGPGNSRASSGGETRVIRATYGAQGIYTTMVARALHLWQENERRWNLKLFFRTGVLWMAGTDDSYERAALPLMKEAGIRFERLSFATPGLPMMRKHTHGWRRGLHSRRPSGAHRPMHRKILRLASWALFWAPFRGC